MDDLTIDWKTAKVTHGERGTVAQQLTLWLSGKPDARWCVEFQKHAGPPHSDPGTRWVVVSQPSSDRRHFIVSGLTDGAEREIRQELNEVVAATNAAVKRAESEDEARIAAQAKIREEQDEADRKMTERFRSA